MCVLSMDFGRNTGMVGNSRWGADPGGRDNYSKKLGLWLHFEQASHVCCTVVLKSV